MLASAAIVEHGAGQEKVPFPALIRSTRPRAVEADLVLHTIRSGGAMVAIFQEPR
jgi:hypothetical protein